MQEPTAITDPRIGSVLEGRYRILDRIAAGGMGVIYRGERVELGRPVAIKFLHPWIARDEEFRRRFQVEARAMSRLAHPCCVSVIDYGVDGDSPYMVMDYVTGDTLRVLLRDGAFPLYRALGTIRQILAGLAHAHEQGIVHRDIKPENIILTEAVGIGAQVRILDFGLAKLRDGVTGLTTGFMLGTPSYMAPEQIRSEAVDARIDLYATGVVLFELLTGKKPFIAQEMSEVLRMHREAPPPLLRQVAPSSGFPAALEAVLVKAMAKAPGDRFQSAAEFVSALDAAVPQFGANTSTTPVDFRSSHEEITSRPSAASAPTPVVVALPSVTPVVTPPSMTPAGTIPSTPPSGSMPMESTAASSAPSQAASAPAAQASASGDAMATPAALAATSLATPASSSALARMRPALPKAAIGGACAVLVLLGLVFAFRGGDPSPSEGTASGAEPGARSSGAEGKPVPAPAPAQETAKRPQETASAPAADHSQGPAPEELPGIDAARRLVKAGRRDQALRALATLRAKYPNSAYVRFLEGNVNFHNLRWMDGVASYRAAIRNDPGYRKDPTVIRDAIRCLVSDRFHRVCTEFIVRDLNAAAVPYLEEAARTDSMANVRYRAERVLRQLAAQRASAGTR